MALHHGNILVHLLFVFHGLRAGRAQLPFPPLTNFTAADVGKPAFVFDGLDYDTLPPHIRPEYHDCYQEQYRCLRVRNHIDPVCGYNEYTKKWDPYFSLCHLNHQNCIEMVNKKKSMYGEGLKDRFIYYLGDGKRCEFDVRRFLERLQSFPLAAAGRRSLQTKSRKKTQGEGEVARSHKRLAIKLYK